MSEHFKEVCSKCRTVVRQCRCADPNKKVTHVICESCLKKIGEGVQPSPLNSIERVKDLTHRLNSILQNPEPGLFVWHETVGNLMRELRDELNVVLDGSGP
jgi:hypothetical protein